MSVLLHGESHGQRSLVIYSPWGLKDSDMTEMTVSTQSSFDKVTGTHFFVCIISGEEPI